MVFIFFTYILFVRAFFEKKKKNKTNTCYLFCTVRGAILIRPKEEWPLLVDRFVFKRPQWPISTVKYYVRPTDNIINDTKLKYYYSNTTGT